MRKLLNKILSYFHKTQERVQYSSELSTNLANEKIREFILTVCTANQIRKFMDL